MKISDEDLARLGFKRHQYNMPNILVDFLYGMRYHRDFYLSQLPLEIFEIALNYLKYDKKEILINRDASHYILIETDELTILTKNFDDRIAHNCYIELYSGLGLSSTGLDDYILIGFTIRRNSLFNDNINKPILFKPENVCILEKIHSDDILGSIINSNKIWRYL